MKYILLIVFFPIVFSVFGMTATIILLMMPYIIATFLAIFGLALWLRHDAKKRQQAIEQAKAEEKARRAQEREEYRQLMYNRRAQ